MERKALKSFSAKLDQKLDMQASWLAHQYLIRTKKSGVTQTPLFFGLIFKLKLT